MARFLPNYPIPPAKKFIPSPQEIEENIADDSVPVIIMLVSFISAFIVFAIIFHIISYPVFLSIFPALLCLPFVYIVHHIKKKLSIHNQAISMAKKMQIEIDKQYEQDLNKYKEDIESYNRQYEYAQEKVAQAKVSRKAVIDVLHIAIAQNRETDNRINEKLTQLYGQNVLHPQFRNMVAINTIREYVEMGICEGLEGATGAYAEYMKDVRTERITNSIARLENTLTHSINELQQSLSMQLGAVRQSITGMQMSLDSSMNDIRQEISSGNHTLAAELGNISSGISSTNQGLQNLSASAGQAQKYIENLAHNQYVDLREKHIDNYMVKTNLLKDPNRI